MTRTNIPDDEIWSWGGNNDKPDRNRFEKGNESGQTALPPKDTDHNFQMNRSDKNVQYILRNGLLPWDNAETYSIGAVVLRSSSIYECLKTSVNNDPIVSSEYWKLFHPSLMLKRTRLDFEDAMTLSLLPLGQSPRPEWILPDSASKAKFVNLEINIKVTDNYSAKLDVYCHDSDDGNDANAPFPIAVKFPLPYISSVSIAPYTIVIPITLPDGGTAKRLSFHAFSGGLSTTTYTVAINDIWESE